MQTALPKKSVNMSGASKAKKKSAQASDMPPAPEGTGVSAPASTTRGQKRKSDIAVSASDEQPVTTTKRTKVAVTTTNPPETTRRIAPHQVQKAVQPVIQEPATKTVVTQKTVKGGKKRTNPAESEAMDVNAVVTPAQPSKKIKSSKKGGNQPHLRRTGSSFFLHQVERWLRVI